MRPLRTICLLWTVLCAGACAAEDVTTPKASEPWHLPVLLDASYNWRLQPTRGWHGVDAMLRLRLDELWPGQGAYHQIALASFFETGYAYDPNPTRAAVMLGYGWGKDFFDRDPRNNWNLFDSDGGFPMTHSPGYAYGVQVLAGLHSSRGTGGSSRVSRSVDAFRLEARALTGIFFAQLESRLAVHFNLRSGRFVDGEFYTGIVVARPSLPVGIRLGWSYLFTQRTGGGFFVLGIVVAL